MFSLVENQDSSGWANMADAFCFLTSPCGEEPGYSLPEKFLCPVLLCQRICRNLQQTEMPDPPHSSSKERELGCQVFYISSKLSLLLSFRVFFFFLHVYVWYMWVYVWEYMWIQGPCAHMYMHVCKRRPSFDVQCLPPLLSVLFIEAGPTN